MSASSVFKFLGRLAMVGAFAMAVWFIIFGEWSTLDSDAEKQAEGKENTQENNGEGASPNAKDGMGGEKLKKPEAESETVPGHGGRELRTVQVIHLHLPGDPDSRALSESLAEIRMSWPDHLTISTLDVTSKQQTLGDWRVSRAPAVVFQNKEQRLYSFEGLWPKDRLAKKIEALIHGLVIVDKDWRPEVKGLERR